MTDFAAADETFSLYQLTLITGLTDRTLRNYLADGFLQGEKVNGAWRFTSEQVQALVNHPAVRPAILAKKNAMIYDFLLDDQKQAAECCLVLDVPGMDCQQAMAFFGSPINSGNHRNIRFSYDNNPSGTPRIILRGYANDVLTLANRYQDAHLR